MCEKEARPLKLLVLTSVTEVSSGRKCCAVNNGRPHTHVIRAENQRREKIHIRGVVRTRSSVKQLMFSKVGSTADEWNVDFNAYGQIISSEEAQIHVGAVHSKMEDIEAELEYRYDDPFDANYKTLSMTIGVTL